MKNLVLLFIVLLLAKYNLFAQNGWYEQTSNVPVDLHSIYMLNADTGWIAGDGIILKTTSGGNIWQNIYSGGGTPYSLYFTDKDNGYWSGDAAGWNGGVIRKTSDGGINWELIWGGEFDSPQLNSLQFIGSDTGWAVGNGGTIVKTTDGGQSWINQISGTSTFLNTVFFVNNSLGWAAGDSSIILYTTNGGQDWNEQFSDLGNSSINSVFFIDELNGWAAGYSGTMLKTTNGGANWSIQTAGTYMTLNTIYFVNQNFGWILGGFGIIKRTTNAGGDWTDQTSGPGHDLTSGYFVDQNTGWAVGNNGTILHTTNGGVSLVDDATSQPTIFILEQNYPNPFNPSTTISWQSPVGSHQVIKLFDVLGREVETIVDGYYGAGNHSAFYIVNSALPSGVYFYRLKAGEFVKTKKMILIK